ncbi:hypothetical protein NM688_g38 [Phlebia brevispora]|uniref:Uncharacterized protein n=1 Tax=Phlebia brevispora TaxID=194682 RepID=A0ACC1TFT0_9APHY|nr:hypothetical protein NM688_g38 [Phlebia brevispora]
MTVLGTLLAMAAFGTWQHASEHMVPAVYDAPKDLNDARRAISLKAKLPAALHSPSLCCGYLRERDGSAIHAFHQDFERHVSRHHFTYVRPASCMVFCAIIWHEVCSFIFLSRLKMSLMPPRSVMLMAGYMKILFERKVKTVANRILFATVLVQFCIVTAHVAICLQEAIEGLVDSLNPGLSLANQGTPLHIAQLVLSVVNNFISDIVLAWRMYVVWNRNVYLVILVIPMIISATVCGFVDTVILANLTTEQQLFSETVRRWALGSWCSSIGAQMASTLLIAWKVWWTHIGTVGPHKSQMTLSVMWVILESGAVLSFSQVIVLALYVQKMAVGGVIIAMVSQLDALVPTSIFVRLASTNQLEREKRSITSSRYRSWLGSRPHNATSTLVSTPAGNLAHEDHEIYEMNEKNISSSVMRTISVDAQA